MMIRHILVVEDEPGMSELLEERFRNAGFRVTTARDGETAIEAARTYYPDLILLDLGLPGLPGEEVCRALKHSYDRALRAIPIIMVTGKASDVDRVVGTVMGAVDYVAKPVSLAEIVQKVEHLLAA